MHDPGRDAPPEPRAFNDHEGMGVAGRWCLEKWLWTYPKAWRW